jgi:nucleolar protein 14
VISSLHQSAAASITQSKVHTISSALFLQCVLPQELFELLQQTEKAIEYSLTKCRQRRRPLVKLSKANVIKEYEPDFNEKYRPGMNMDPLKERKEFKQLEKKFKRDKKGAMRELRRDTQFIAAEKRKADDNRLSKLNAQKAQVRSMLAREQQDTNLKAKMSKKSQRKNTV